MSTFIQFDLVNSFVKEYYYLLWLCFAILTLLFGGYRWGRKIWHKLSAFWRTDVRELKRLNRELEQKLSRVRTAFDAGNHLWLRQPIVKPERYDAKIQNSIPILLIANMKGGVGKTTLAANLAAYFERRRNERVLAIDIDYQGSLSSMLLPEPMNRQERTAQAVKVLIKGGPNANGDFTIANSNPIRKSNRDSRVIDCDDPFEDFETQLLLEWLIGDINEDIRYDLARVLHSNEIQDAFDRVIIDAPPRLTIGFVNALCASTHFVVPFVLDILSAERIGKTLQRIKSMRGQLFPHIELAAVVGTMKGDKTPTLRDAEKRAIEEAKRRVRRYWGPGDYVLDRYELLIPRKQPIADVAGLGIAYDNTEVQEIFDRLGHELANRAPNTKQMPLAAE